MSNPTQDEMVARVLSGLAQAAGVLGTALGQPVAGKGAQAVLTAASDAIRKRGVSTDELVAGLKQARPLNMPWSGK